jgi:hypothetical protein
MQTPNHHEPSAEAIKKAMLPDNEPLDPLDELIATGEAVFNLIRFSELDLYVKNAFFQLEKQFTFYANLVNRVE